ncbi:MAG: hypothetical protein ACK4UV_12245, partial [Ignavibacterium sp.]
NLKILGACIATEAANEKSHFEMESTTQLKKKKKKKQKTNQKSCHDFLINVSRREEKDTHEEREREREREKCIVSFLLSRLVFLVFFGSPRACATSDASQ